MGFNVVNIGDVYVKNVLNFFLFFYIKNVL